MQKLWVRKIATLLTITICLSSFTAWSATKPIAGKPCSKVGSIQKAGGFEFTCKKSGNRLIWSKRVLIPVSKPTSTPNSKPTAAPSPIPADTTISPSPSPSSPSPSPQYLEGDCQKQYLESIIDGVYAMCTFMNGKLTWQINTLQKLRDAWSDTKSFKDAKPLPNTALDARFSPLVNREIANAILGSLKSSSQFWQDQFLPKNPMPVLFFTEKEKTWFGDQMVAIGLHSECINQQLAQFDDEVRRNGNHANMAGFAGCNGITFFDFYIGTGRNEIGINELRVGAHEYTHSGQFGALGDTGSDFAPCWLIEGGAEFYGITLGARDVKDIIAMRQDHVWGNFYLDNSNLATKDPLSIQKFIEENGDHYDHYTCGPNGAYPVGAIATEYLFTLKGQEGQLDFFAEIKKTQNYKAAIKNVFGVSWEEMRARMANYINLVVAQTPKPNN